MLVDATKGSRPVAGAWVYIWHCDRDGAYSDLRRPAGPGQLEDDLPARHPEERRCGLCHLPHALSQLVRGRHHAHCLHGVPRQRDAGQQQLPRWPPRSSPSLPASRTRSTPAVLYGKGPNTSVLRLVADNVFGDGGVSEMQTLTGSEDAGYAAARGRRGHGPDGIQPGDERPPASALSPVRHARKQVAAPAAHGPSCTAFWRAAAGPGRGDMKSQRRLACAVAALMLTVGGRQLAATVNRRAATQLAAAFTGP